MGVFKSVVGGTLKSMVDVPSWIGYKYLKQHSRYLYSAFKGICTPQQATHKESYEQALKRLNLDEAELLNKQKSLVRTTIIFLVCGFLTLIYMGLYICYRRTFWRCYLYFVSEPIFL